MKQSDTKRGFARFCYQLGLSKEKFLEGFNIVFPDWRGRGSNPSTYWTMVEKEIQQTRDMIARSHC